MGCPILQSHRVLSKESVAQEYKFVYACVCVHVCVFACVTEWSACACPLKPRPSGDPGVQNECLGSGHLGWALPSVSQICFLTHKPNQAGNHHRSAWLRSRTLVISHSPTIRHSMIRPLLAVTRSLTVELYRHSAVTPMKPSQTLNYKETRVLLNIWSTQKPYINTQDCQDCGKDVIPGAYVKQYD